MPTKGKAKEGVKGTERRVEHRPQGQWNSALAKQGSSSLRSRFTGSSRIAPGGVTVLESVLFNIRKKPQIYKRSGFSRLLGVMGLYLEGRAGTQSSRPHAQKYNPKPDAKLPTACTNHPMSSQKMDVSYFLHISKSQHLKTRSRMPTRLGRICIRSCHFGYGLLRRAIGIHHPDVHHEIRVQRVTAVQGAR